MNRVPDPSPLRAAALLAVLGACAPGGEPPAPPEDPVPAETAHVPLDADPAPDPDATARAGSTEERAELERLRTEVERLRAERAELAEELSEERRLRYERELAWLEYTRTVADLDVRAMIEATFAPHLPETFGPEPPEDPPEPSPAERARRERADEIAVSLRNRMRIEGVRGLDLLELGALGVDDGHGTAGPAVFRLLDDRGRLTGSLYAERLRLEGSRAAHTVTLVLEDGYESRGGQRFPFGESGRRIVLPHVDPEPWMEAVPELFALEDVREAGDDGLWDRDRVRTALNDKLREDAAGGFYLLHRDAGVRDGTFLDVQLGGFDEAGRLERRLFADRMRIVAQERGVQLVLEEGAIVRGTTTTPFPGGDFRIFLPTADPAAWRDARLPGLSAPDLLHEPAGPESAGPEDVAPEDAASDADDSARG